MPKDRHFGLVHELSHLLCKKRWNVGKVKEKYDNTNPCEPENEMNVPKLNTFEDPCYGGGGLSQSPQPMNIQLHLA